MKRQIAPPPDSVLIGVMLTLGEWNRLTQFLLDCGMSRHSDTYKSIVGQVEYGGSLAPAKRERRAGG